MYEKHISDEDIKKFVSYKGTLSGEEGKVFIELVQKVNTHIRGCQECLDRLRAAQMEQERIDRVEAGVSKKDIARADVGRNITGPDTDRIARTMESIFGKPKSPKSNGKGEK